ncbi:MAG: hypothetical protein V2A54_16150 [Bacteroidota bacterium]
MKTRNIFLTLLFFTASISVFAQNKNLADRIQECRTFMNTKGIELKLDTLKLNETGKQDFNIVLNKDVEYSFILTGNCYGVSMELVKDSVLCNNFVNGKDYYQGFNYVCQKSGIYVLRYNFKNVSNKAFKGAMIYYFVSKLSKSDGSVSQSKNNVFPLLVKE